MRAWILFAILLLCILCGSCRAQLALNNAPFAALLSSSRYFNPLSNYVFSESFEAPGYENTWTTNGSLTVDPADSSAPLQGLYSLHITLSAQNGGVRAAWSAQSNVYGFFMIRFSNLPSTGTTEDFIAFNVGSTKVLSMSLAGGNVLRVIDASATAQAATVATIANNTTYNVWWSYQAGTGANAKYTVAFSTTTTQPVSGNNYAETLVGGQSAFVDTIRCGADNLPGTDAWEAKFDKIRISTTPIGDNPL